MSTVVRGVEVPDNVATRVTPTEADETKAALLSLLAEGKPYVFLVPESGEDESGQYIVVTLSTDIDETVIVRTVLDVASDSLTAAIGDGQE